MKNINKKKLEMLEKFYQLEQKRKGILVQMQQLQAMGNDIAQEMDTLNKQFELLMQIDKKEEGK